MAAPLLSGTALLVTGSTALNAGDAAIKNRLQGLGLTVQVKAASAAVTADATNKALVAISSTVTSGDVGGKFTAVRVPVLTWESALFDDLGLVASGSTNLGTQADQTALNVVAPSHPVAGGLSGVVTVATAATPFSWGRPGTAAVRIATLSTDSSRAVVFGYDGGATLASGAPAPARRLAFFLGDNTSSTLNPSGWGLFDRAVTWAAAPAAASTTVKLSIANVDDFVYITVDGVRRKVGQVRVDESLTDVSGWFAGGANDVRIQIINTGGPASYSVQLRVDDAVVIDATCASAPCDATTPPGEGIVFDHTYQVQIPNRPARQMVTINAPVGGQLYLNDAYTGRTIPTSLSLPPGDYTLGSGVSQDSPGNYTGMFYEQVIHLANAPVTANLVASPVTQTNATRVAILPIRHTVHGDATSANTGILQDSDVVAMREQADATRRGFVEPFSYGLTTWSIDVLPTVENTTLFRDATPRAAPNSDQFLIDANLQSLKQSYDIIIFFYSKYTADGSEVANSPCCFWGLNQSIMFSNLMTRGGWPTNPPNIYLLHESLHDYESYNQSRLGLYNGIAGTHGAGIHGYVFGGGGEEDFAQFYRPFMRGQVAELDGMRNGVDWTGGVPAAGDLYVGLFSPFRRGVNWQAASSATANVLVAGSHDASSTVTPGGAPSPCALPTPMPPAAASAR